MRRLSLLALAAFLSAVTGCASGPTPAQLARKERVREAQRKEVAAERQIRAEAAEKETEKQKQKIAQNWNKLHAGMTVTEVDELIGPFAEGFAGPLKLAELFLGSGDAAVKSSCDLRVEERFYVLKFGNEKCTLTEFSLK